ncbi:Rv1733c family protein [Streptomyces sp. B21-083]|uniref:Rv1733c family protein n=1 Tax=Streptomyces sp. B21-083 TaxID=3039410 RepID=UPI00303F7B56
MSAQGSPYASGPPSGRGDNVPKGANPLRRTSDRLECWLRRVLMVVLVVGLPAAAVSAGLASYEASMRTVRAQAAERHEVTARLTARVKSDDELAKRPAQVRWTDADGDVRTGAALVKPGTPKGATVRVWVTRDGTVTSPPVSTLNATTSGWMVGGMAAFGVAAGSYAARAGMRLVLDRRRYARWDAEWDLVEPQWSARFRR